MIRYLVERGADVMVVSRRGETTVDIAHGPFQRTHPFSGTIALREGLGTINNHSSVSGWVESPSQLAAFALGGV